MKLLIVLGVAVTLTGAGPVSSETSTIVPGL